ncbi:hypothetical protein HWV62_33089 [Athelia sp. TMB]|nr:hypothetical protein HWV62_34579 [Athelia sp. TMB]KAF7981519.1 hypothetical protein HWV62_33089 [Athelia sp. TMB]
MIHPNYPWKQKLSPDSSNQSLYHHSQYELAIPRMQEPTSATTNILKAEPASTALWTGRSFEKLFTDFGSTSSLVAALSPPMKGCDPPIAPDQPQSNVIRKSRQVPEMSKKPRSTFSIPAKSSLVSSANSATSQAMNSSGMTLSPAKDNLAAMPPAIKRRRRRSRRLIPDAGPHYTKTSTPHFSSHQRSYRAVAGPFRWEAYGDQWLTCRHCNDFAGKRPRDIERHAIWCLGNPNRLQFSDYGDINSIKILREVAESHLRQQSVGDDMAAPPARPVY